MELPAEQVDDPAEDAQQLAPVGVVAEDLAAFVAAGGDVPEGAGVVEAKRAAHAASIV